ncbi:arginine N-succinyltransferase [Escherichia coli]
MLEKEGFRYRNYIDIFDGGPTLECDIDRVRAIRKSRLVEVAEGQPAQGDFPACLVANEIITISAWCWCVPIRQPSV